MPLPLDPESIVIKPLLLTAFQSQVSVEFCVTATVPVLPWAGFHPDPPGAVGCFGLAGFSFSLLIFD